MAKTLEFPALGLFCNYTSGNNQILYNLSGSRSFLINKAKFSYLMKAMRRA